MVWQSQTNWTNLKPLKNKTKISGDTGYQKKGEDTEQIQLSKLLLSKGYKIESRTFAKCAERMMIMAKKTKCKGKIIN